MKRWFLFLCFFWHIKNHFDIWQCCWRDHVDRLYKEERFRDSVEIKGQYTTMSAPSWVQPLTILTEVQDEREGAIWNIPPLSWCFYVNDEIPSPLARQAIYRNMASSFKGYVTTYVKSPNICYIWTLPFLSFDNLHRDVLRAQKF